jgi:hypothetical protein
MSLILSQDYNDRLFGLHAGDEVEMCDSVPHMDGVRHYRPDERDKTPALGLGWAWVQTVADPVLVGAVDLSQIIIHREG